jgi:hypothetical protein
MSGSVLQDISSELGIEIRKHGYMGEGRKERILEANSYLLIVLCKACNTISGQ